MTTTYRTTFLEPLPARLGPLTAGVAACGCQEFYGFAGPAVPAIRSERCATHAVPDPTVPAFAETVLLACQTCGTPLTWEAEDLRYHLRRLDRGEHAACACDDDCAAEAEAWDRATLLALIEADSADT